MQATTSTDTQTTADRPSGVKRYTTGPLPLGQAKTRADRLEAVLANLMRNGMPDATVRELCTAFERTYGVQLFPHHGEAGLAALEAAGRVQCDREHKRPCTVTGVAVKVYRLQAQQVSWL